MIYTEHSQEKLDFFNNKNKGVYEIDTLEISHPDLSQTYRICRDIENNKFRLEDNTLVDFQAVNFNVSPVKLDERIEATLEFEIDIINFKMVKELNEIFSGFQEHNMTIIYRTYIKNKREAPVIGPRYFELQGFSIAKDAMSASANIHEFVNVKFPTITFDTRIYPGILYAEQSE